MASLAAMLEISYKTQQKITCPQLSVKGKWLQVDKYGKIMSNLAGNDYDHLIQVLGCDSNSWITETTFRAQHNKDLSAVANDSTANIRQKTSDWLRQNSVTNNG